MNLHTYTYLPSLLLYATTFAHITLPYACKTLISSHYDNIPAPALKMMGCAMTLPDVAPASSSQDELETSHPANTPSSVGLTFFDLPQEIRDQIFLRHPKRAWIDLAQVPEEAMQPNASKVSRRMRVETLDVVSILNSTPPFQFTHYVSRIEDR